MCRRGDKVQSYLLYSLFEFLNVDYILHHNSTEARMGEAIQFGFGARARVHYFHGGVEDA